MQKINRLMKNHLPMPLIKILKIIKTALSPVTQGRDFY